MARQSPLLQHHQSRDAIIAPYGPPDGGLEPPLVVQAFGEVDLEYAAIRKGCILIDLPHRATFEVTGADRTDFLNRMLTQELKGFAPFMARSSFWLSRKGRIDADLRLVALPDRIVIDVDIHAAKRALDGLNGYIITEDVTITDATERLHRLALHGPAARAALARVTESVKAGPDPATLAVNAAAVVVIAGREVIVDRDDLTGDVGLFLTLATADVPAVYAAIAALGARALKGEENAAFSHRGEFHLREAGWAAFNVARIEGGSPTYYLDFTPESLAHETGVLASRVSFTKGCYLGQEIVARMQSLGAPKQKVVGLRLERAAGANAPYDPAIEPQPDTGSPVYAAPEGAVDRNTLGEPIGQVTSSAVSPMLSGTVVCFATVRSKSAAPGSRILVEAEGQLLGGEIRAELPFFKRASEGANA